MLSLVNELRRDLENLINVVEAVHERLPRGLKELKRDIKFLAIVSTRGEI